MRCLKCGMAPYLPDWYKGEVICPCCGHYPEHGRPVPVVIPSKLNNMLLNEGPVIKDHSYKPNRVLTSGCKWWEGRLSDGEKKTCFNCGWEDCVKSDQVGNGKSKNYIYKAREARLTGMVHPDGQDDCYKP